MNFDNDSPFPALRYDIVDAHDVSAHVIVARGTFDLRPPAPRDGDSQPTITHLAIPAAEQVGIAVSDDYFGEMNRSSVKTESDLAQHKPRCDIIVIGSVHSPTGEPVPRIDVGIGIQRLRAIPGLATAGTLLERRLVVHGARRFERRGGGWVLTDPEPFTSLPIRYEHAFGGELKVYEGDEAAQRVDRAYRLGPELRGKHPEGAAAPVAHTTCLLNPVGIGFLEAWYADAAKVEHWPAPRIEAPGALITADVFNDLVHGRARPGDRPELVPRGMGVIAKPWQPRLALAGTFDDRWLAERWPYMPSDFDMAYWNGAHPEMQCEYLLGGELVSLWNLLPFDRQRRAQVPCIFTVPEVFLAAWCTLESGETAFVPAVVDTMVLDLDASRVSLVWRVALREAAGIDSAALVAVGSTSTRETA